MCIYIVFTNVCVCVYIYIYIHTHMYTHTRAHVHTHTHTHTPIYNIHIYRFVYRKRPTPQFRRAEEHYMKALELNPQHCEAASYVGELYLQIEHFEEAAAAYSRLQALSLCSLTLLLALLIALRIASLITLRCFLGLRRLLLSALFFGVALLSFTELY